MLSGLQAVAGYGDELVENFRKKFGPLLTGDEVANIIHYTDGMAGFPCGGKDLLMGAVKSGPCYLTVLSLLAAIFVVGTAAARTPKGGGHMIKVKVLSIAGCEATPSTIELVREAADGLGIEIVLDHLVVESPEQAAKERFIGSPTVQVNGRDIEPAARGARFFGVT